MHTTRRHFGFADVLTPVQALGATRSDYARARGRALATVHDARTDHNV
jgi:hypothetical protein